MTTTDTPEQAEHEGREPVLGYYLNRPVTGATLQIAGTGAGLDRGLDMPQVALQPGDHYDVVLRCVVTEHRHEFSEEFDAYQLVNRLKAVTATIPQSGETAADAITRAQRTIEMRKDGVDERQMTFEDPDGPRGGEPQAVGDVLGNVDALIGSADRRNARTKQLDALAKPELKALADGYEITGRSSMTVAELVEAVVDHEDDNGLLPDDEAGEGDADA